MNDPCSVPRDRVPSAAQTSNLVAEELGELFMDGPVTRVNENLSGLEVRMSSLDSAVRDHLTNHDKRDGRGFQFKDLKWFGSALAASVLIIAALLGVKLPF